MNVLMQQEIIPGHYSQNLGQWTRVSFQLLIQESQEMSNRKCGLQKLNSQHVNLEYSLGCHYYRVVKTLQKSLKNHRKRLAKFSVTL